MSDLFIFYKTTKDLLYDADFNEDINLYNLPQVKQQVLETFNNLNQEDKITVLYLSVREHTILNKIEPIIKTTGKEINISNKTIAEKHNQIELVKLKIWMVKYFLVLFTFIIIIGITIFSAADLTNSNSKIKQTIDGIGDVLELTTK